MATRVELGRVTVLLGPPASGKSNILEALETIGYLLRVGLEAEAGLWPSAERVGLLGDYVRLRACTDLLSHYEAREEATITLAWDGYRARVELRCISPLEARAELRVEKSGETILRYVMGGPVAEPGLGAVEQGEGRGELGTLLSLLSMLERVRRQRLSVKRVEARLEPGVALLAPRLYGFDRMDVPRRIAAGETGERLPPYPTGDARNLGWILYANRAIYMAARSVIESISGIDVRVLSDGRILFFDGVVDVPPSGASDTIARILYTVTALLASKPLKATVDGATVTLEPVVMLEEPEAHVYPVAFRHLVDLVREASRHAYILVTTHSGRLAELLWEKTGAIIYYVERDSQGTRLYKVDMEKLIENMHDLDDLIYLGVKVLEETSGNQ